MDTRSIRWKILYHKAKIEDLGLLPDIIRGDDPHTVKEQIEERYYHGGGYRPFGEGKFTLLGGDAKYLKYPGDPPFRALARLIVNGELVIVYEHDLVMIMQPHGAFVVVRMD